MRPLCFRAAGSSFACAPPCVAQDASGVPAGGRVASWHACLNHITSPITCVQGTFGKLEATAAKLRASQEGTARELVEQQVR